MTKVLTALERERRNRAKWRKEAIRKEREAAQPGITRIEAHQANERKLMLEGPSDLTSEQLCDIRRRQWGKCNGCNRPFDPKGHMTHETIDHIHPVSKGGTLTLSNIQLLCLRCNLLKSDGTMADLQKRLDQRLRNRGFTFGDPDDY